TETDDVILTVAMPPTCSISGASSTCPKSTSQFSAPAGLPAYSWSVTGNGSISGPTNSQTVTLSAGAACAAPFTFMFNLRSTIGGCSVACTTDVMVSDTTPPVITSIPPDVTVQCAAAVPAPNDKAVTATDNCTGTIIITHSDQTTPGTCANKFVVQRTYTATDSCGNSSSLTQTITVNDT